MHVHHESDRVLKLEGVHNFRDYGGYPVADGGRLRRGLLWRSGQHHGATEADLAAIEAIALTSVFDLRVDAERKSHPCRRPAGFAARIREAASPSVESAPHIAAARTVRQRTPESTRAGLLRNYETIAFRPQLQEMIADHLTELADGRGASLVNCMAGKDRTGIAVAMVHLATGVHRDDILADYLMTNTAGDPEARIQAGMDVIRARTGEIDEASARVLMGVEAEYLETALAAIEQRHGSTDAYLESELGLDPAKRQRLREVLVES